MPHPHRAALQMMYKATKQAQVNNYYVGGLSHTWMGYYTVMLTADGTIVNEWSVGGITNLCLLPEIHLLLPLLL